MHIRRTKKDCVECGSCASSCPKTDSFEEFKTIIRCDPSACQLECTSACQRNAIQLAGSTPSIISEKCNGCGACADACPLNAIIIKEGKAVKCDLCSDHGFPKCINACPYNALHILPSKEEKKMLDSLLGYEKRRVRWTSVLEENKNIICIDRKNRKRYVVRGREPWLEEARVVHGLLQERLDDPEFDVEADLEDYCESIGVKLSEETKPFLANEIRKELEGYSILSELISDPEIEEIAVNGTEQPVRVYHNVHQWLDTNIWFTSNQKITDIANKMAMPLGRRLSAKSPRLNANIPLGRLHAAQFPVSKEGIVLTIRKFKEKPLTPSNLARNQTITPEALAWLWEKILEDKNVLVSGSTGSGKTTTLNALLCFVPVRERIIVVEETPEVTPPHEHVVRLTCAPEAGISMSQLVTDTLRMRPDRVVVGEVRDKKEVEALVDTMLAGQGKSSFATFHAQTGKQAVQRLKSLGVGEEAIPCFNIIVCQNRWTDYETGEDLRKVTEIGEITEEGYAPVFAYQNKTLKNLQGKKQDKEKVSFIEDSMLEFREYSWKADDISFGRKN